MTHLRNDARRISVRHQACRIASTALVVLALAVPDPGPAQVPESRNGMVPLITWYSESRGDYFTTTDPAWRAAVGAIRSGQGDYRAIHVEGWVYDPSRPQPPGTVTLYHWWSASRQDNFLTSDPAWRGEVGDVRPGQGDYRLFRIEGYASGSGGDGRLALTQYWSGARQDNLTTGTNAGELSGYRAYRTAGYVVPDAGSGDPRGPVTGDAISDADWAAARAQSARIIVQTGGDNLRGTSRFASYIRLRDGRVLRRESLNCRREGDSVHCRSLDNLQQDSFEWDFGDDGPRVGDIQRFGIDFTSIKRIFTDSDDEWLVRSVEVLLTGRLPDGSVDTRVLYAGEGRPLIRFRGSGEWEVPVRTYD